MLTRLAQVIRSAWSTGGGASMPTMHVFFPSGNRYSKCESAYSIRGKRAKDFDKVKVSLCFPNCYSFESCTVFVVEEIHGPSLSSGSAKCSPCCSLAHGMIHLGSMSPPCCKVWVDHGPHDSCVDSQPIKHMIRMTLFNSMARLPYFHSTQHIIIQGYQTTGDAVMVNKIA
jgi:hypothetical protein